MTPLSLNAVANGRTTSSLSSEACEIKTSYSGVVSTSKSIPRPRLCINEGTEFRGNCLISGNASGKTLTELLTLPRIPRKSIATCQCPECVVWRRTGDFFAKPPM